MTSTSNNMTTISNKHRGKEANDRLKTFLIHSSNVVAENVPSFNTDYKYTLYDEICEQTLGERTISNPTARKKINNFLAHHTDKVVAVSRIEKPDRQLNECYMNAYKEFCKTGNPMVYAMVRGGSMTTDNFFFLVPHCLNYNPTTKKYYDTTPPYNFQRGERFYSAFLISSHMPPETCYSLPTQTADEVVGGYVFITEEDTTHVILAKNHTDRHLYEQLAYVGTA
jgi:hypothetical protein